MEMLSQITTTEENDGYFPKNNHEETVCFEGIYYNRSFTKHP